MKAVMVAIDSYELLEHAVRMATYLFPGAEEFYLVYLMPVNYSHFWTSDQEKRDLAKREIEEKIREVFSSTNISATTRFKVEIVEDDSAKELMELSKRKDVDAMVIERWKSWKGRGSITKRTTIRTISGSEIPITVLN
jgi:hypothetical protein